MNANPILLQMKYARVVSLFAEQCNLSLETALDFFYHSQLYQLVKDGISDMHCMSDAYMKIRPHNKFINKIPNKSSSIIYSLPFS